MSYLIMETIAGHKTIRVRTFGDPDGKEFAYAWAGGELTPGDSFIVHLDDREWNVEFVGYGTDYLGQLRVIGGPFGKTYSTDIPF